MTHPGMTGKVSNRDPLKPQRPRDEKMKSAVPGEIVNSGRSLEKDNWSSGRCWRLTGNLHRCASDFQIIQSANQSALEILGIKILHCQQIVTESKFGIIGAKQPI
jgi:hypothetical protein